MGRTFLLSAAALVLGTLIGAFQPRGELLALREQVAYLERRARGAQRGAAGAGLREFFRAPPAAADPAPAPAPAEISADGPVPEGSPPAEAAEANAANTPADKTGPSADDVESMVAALDARAAQARAALMEQADLDDEQLEAIDDAMERMNEKLKRQVDAFAQSVEAGAEPDRRELMEFAAEALDAVIEADDAIVANIPESVRAEMDEEALDPMSFISGETLAAIATLEGG